MLHIAMALGQTKSLLESFDPQQRTKIHNILSGIASAGLVNPNTKPLLYSGVKAAIASGDVAENLNAWMSSPEALAALEEQKKVSGVGYVPKAFICPHCDKVTSLDALG